MALEERIGNVSTGLSEEIIINQLRQQKYSIAVCSLLEAEPCCICQVRTLLAFFSLNELLFIIAGFLLFAGMSVYHMQEEYNDGDDLGTLECGHNFHADCIKQWLMHKNLCPICKTTALTK